MRHLRHTLLWLCSFALVFGGVLGRGFVLCVGSDGVVRVEAPGATGTCALNAERADIPASRTGGEPLTLDSACGGCTDVTMADGSTQFPPSGTHSLVEPTPLVIAWLVAGVDPTFEPATRAARPDALPLGPRSSDLYAVRETIVLLI